jgi:Uma2 family endonuclease
VHFALWSAELSRWQGVPDPPPGIIGESLVKKFGQFILAQHRRPIRLEVPSDWDAYEWRYTSFWDRRLWPSQPAGFEHGFDHMQDHWDIKLNLWRIFQEEQDSLGIEGDGMGGVDVVLSDRDVVQPDFFFFPGPRVDHLFADQYFKGVPQIVVEVLSPFSRAIDRGPRKEVYRRAGVPELWLIEPLTRTIESYQLSGGEYHLHATAHAGDQMRVVGLKEMAVDAERVFATQSSRFKDETVHDDDDNDNANPPAWALPPNREIGLQHLILLGHTERRREIWSNQSPCFLAFGSPDEARHRLNRFLLEAARWQRALTPPLVEVEPGMEAANVGPFHFVRQGHIVRLNVDASAERYRELLQINAQRAAWDWGDEEQSLDADV